MIIFPKSISVPWVPLVEPINCYFMIIFPKLIWVTRIPLVKPISSYHMDILPNLTSVTRVPGGACKSLNAPDGRTDGRTHTELQYIDLTAPTVAAGKNWKKIEEQEGFNGMQMVQFECPRHSNPTLSFNFEVCKMALFHYCLSGVIRNGPQCEGEKFGKFSEQKGFKGLQMVQFECPRHSNPIVSFSFEVSKMALFHYWLSGVIRNGPQYESEQFGKFQEQKGLKGMQIVQFKCPRHWKPHVLSDFPILYFKSDITYLIGVPRLHSPVVLFRFAHPRPSTEVK